MEAAVSESKSPGMFYGWLMVAVAFLVQALGAGNQYVNGILIQPLAEFFQTSSAQTLFFTSGIMMLSISLIAPLMGFILQRYSLRYFVAVIVAMVGCGYVALGLATQLWQLVLIYALLFSVGMVGSTMATNTLVLHWFDRYRGRALGIAAAGVSAAGFVLPPVMMVGIERFGLQQTCLLFGCAILVLSPVIGFFVVERPEQRGLFSDGAARAAPMASAADAATPSWSLVKLLRSSRFWLIAAVASVCTGTAATLVLNLVPLALHSGIEKQRAAYLLSCAAVFAIVGKIGAGLLVERCSQRYVAVLPVIQLALSCGLLLYADTYWGLLCASVSIGLSMGATTLLVPSLVVSGFGRASFAAVFGAITPFVTLSMSLTLPLFGHAFDSYGSYTQGLLLLCGLLFCAGALSLRFPVAR